MIKNNVGVKVGIIELINNKIVAIILGIICASSLIKGIDEPKIGANTSIYLGNGKWAYTVFIKTSTEFLERIESVEYGLDPYDKDSSYKVTEIGDPLHPYSVIDTGRAAFKVDIKVNLKKGGSQYFTHKLRFISMPIDEPLPITADNTARMAEEGWWDWTVFIKGQDDVLKQVRCVEYTLHPTFPDPVIEVCEPGNETHAFALTRRGWGTFEIQIRVFLKNGQMQRLRHKLKF